MRRTLLSVVLLLIVSKSTHAQSWTPLSVGNTADVMDLSFPSTDTGFASLGNGTVRKTFDGGMTWSNISLHEPNSGGSQIEFLSSMKGFIIDGSGIVATSNGGASWNFCLINLNVYWFDIYFYDQNIGYASGIAPAFDSFLVYKTIDAGVTWLPCTSIHDYNATWPIIFFRTPLEGYIAGSDQIHRTSDGGVTWTSVYTAPGPDLIGTITAPDATNVYCATQYFVDVAKSTNGGNSWVTTGQTLASPAYDSHFLNATHGFICGGTGLTSGYIIETLDGGGSWNPVYGGGQTMLRMDFPSATTGYCGGTGGLVMKYSDPMSAVSVDISLPQVYPNPATEILNIKLDTCYGASTVVCLYSPTMSLIQEMKLTSNEIEINVSPLSSGLYFIVIKDALHEEMQRFVIAR